LQEKLDANVRVEGERRLKALEVQLAQAETAKKEKDMATRYHRIKFFGNSIPDRQKVVRKIHQAKKQLAEAIDDEAKAPLKAALRECRVKLNYILHYPRTEKYISLFPPEVREAGPSNAPHVSNPAQENILSDIRRQMDDGSLPDEPEMHLEKSAQKQTSGRHAKALPSLTKMSVSETPHLKPKTFQSVAQDDFFGEDTDGNDEDD
ncbi:hypothetical protein FISHEDRAFT_27192, partial [Fistulina hepatica ATCC 64428]